MEEIERTYVEASAIEYNNNNVFAQMAARSIVEVQNRVDSVPDLLVLLEVLDYNDAIAKQNGYKDLYSLAVHIYTFIDAYYDYNINTRDEHVKSLLAPIPSLKKRIPEAFVIMFTWIGSLLLLLIIGTTLWIAGFRSPDITTMILLSTFLGLAVMEGPWQTFNLLFMSSYLQGNISGINRLLLKKMYPLDLMIIIATLTGIVIFSIFMPLPLSTMIISVAMCAGIALHKVSMMLMYALKKMSQLMVDLRRRTCNGISDVLRLYRTCSTLPSKVWDCFGGGVRNPYGIYYLRTLQSPKGKEKIIKIGIAR